MVEEANIVVPGDQLAEPGAGAANELDLIIFELQRCGEIHQSSPRFERGILSSWRTALQSEEATSQELLSTYFTKSSKPDITKKAKAD